jgi:hypothetical protein
MGRPQKTTKTVFSNIGLTEENDLKLSLMLFSDLEGKIPYGAKSAFFNTLLDDFFARQKEAAEKLITEQDVPQ